MTAGEIEGHIVEANVLAMRFGLDGLNDAQILAFWTAINTAAQAEFGRMLVAQASARRADDPAYRPTAAELKAVDAVLIEQARARLSVRS